MDPRRSSPGFRSDGDTEVPEVEARAPGDVRVGGNDRNFLEHSCFDRSSGKAVTASDDEFTQPAIRRPPSTLTRDRGSHPYRPRWIREDLLQDSDLTGTLKFPKSKRVLRETFE